MTEYPRVQVWVWAFVANPPVYIITLREMYTIHWDAEASYCHLYPDEEIPF